MFKSLNLENLIKILIISLPISIVIGNFILNINAIFLILLFLFFIKKKNLVFEFKYKKYLLIFIIFVFLNIIFSTNKELSLKGWAGFFKNFLIILPIFYFLHEDNFKKIIFKIYFIIFLFVSLDTLLQYFMGTDIFGFKILSVHGDRLSGPFGDEFVVGSYLSILFFLSLYYLANTKQSNFIIFLFSIFSLIVVFLIKERSAFFMLLMSVTIFYMFIDVSLKKKLFTLLAILGCIFFILKKDPNIYEQYVNKTAEILGVQQNNNNTFLDSIHGAHFLTAYHIFLDNKILGSGAKTFRDVCSKNVYDQLNTKNVKLRCNTHPHNYFLEILSETGLVGSFILIYLVGYLLFYNFKKYYFEKEKIYFILNICILFKLFLPFQTTGSFFSSFNGIFYPLCISFVLYFSNLNFFGIVFKK